MIHQDWQEYATYLDSFKKKRSERCQCDVEFGTCPGVEICPYSDVEQGEETNAES